MASDYTNLATVKADLDILDTNDDTAIARSITAASRAIDRFTGTTFYPVIEARQFCTRHVHEVWVDRFTSVTGLVVATGVNGVFTQVIADVIPWPYNAPSRGLAYTRIDSPEIAYQRETYRPTVQVTASWGWETVPDDVERACRIKAAHLYRRKDSPDGTAGTGEFGVVRISRFEDPDVAMLLGPYMPIGIA